MQNNLEKLFKFIQLLQKLKENKRWGSTSTVIKKESIADHIWKSTVMNFVVYKNLNLKLDFLRIIKLVLVHDLVEAIAGDTDYRLVYLGQVTKEEKNQKELEAMKTIKEMLPKSIGNEICILWSEYEGWATEESKFVKLTEKIESIDHLLYYGHEYFDIPDKMATYCLKPLGKSSNLKGFYAGYVQKLKYLYKKVGFEWKEEYEMQGEFEEFKDFEKIFGFFQLAQKLKEITRYDSSPLIKEKDTVAEHSFRLAFIVLVVQEELKLDIDLGKALSIALFHDIAEAITGDIDYILIHTGKITKEQKHIDELNAINQIKEMLPEKIGNEIFSYWNEYEEGITKEAKFVKALDKFESISHLLYHTHTNFDEPDLVVTYCDKSFQMIPELNGLLKILKRGLKEEYAKGGFERKEEYDVIYKNDRMNYTKVKLIDARTVVRAS